MDRRNQVLARLEARHGKLERPCHRDTPTIEAAGVAGRDAFAIEFDCVIQPLRDEFDTIFAECSTSSDPSVIEQGLLSLGSLTSRMSSVVNEHAHSLPAYDATRAATRLRDDIAKLDTLKETRPKPKKFAFGSRSKKPVSKEQVVEKLVVPTVTKMPAGPSADLSDLTGETRRFGDEVNNSDVLFTRLTNCTVYITGSPSTLHVSHLKSCTIICAPVCTSVFIDNCTECTFVFAAQQMRMHESSNCSVYLHVTSTGIVEACRAITTAPYPFDVKYGLTPNDHWAHLKDFDWLSTQQPSPNWSVLDEEERKVFEL